MTDKSKDQIDRDESDEAPASPESQNRRAAEEIGEATPEHASPVDAESPSSAGAIDLGDAQERARNAAKELLEHEFEGIIKIETADTDGWRTVVEVIERSAVPDTQDILGRYELVLDAMGNITSYELLERYRRGEMKEEL